MLNVKGVQLYNEGKIVEATKLLEEVLKIQKQLYRVETHPRGHPDLAGSLNNLGFLLESQGENAKAEPYLRQALEIREKLYSAARYPQGHPDLANSLNNVGSLLESQGEYAKAEPYYRQALEMREKLFPAGRYPHGHPDLANSLNNLGFLLKSQGEFARAELYHRQALAIFENLYPVARYPNGHPDLATGLNNLGALLKSQGENAKAEPYFRQALEMREKLYPAARYPQGHPKLAASLNNLGLLLTSQGEYAKAEPYHRQALAVFENLYPVARYPQGHPDLAISLDNLGSLLQSQGEYAKAEPYFRQALEMREKLYPIATYPRGHPGLANSVGNLGSLLKAQGEYAKAEPYFRQALEMREKLYPATRYPHGHPDLATSLNNLGSLLESQGESAKAEPYYRKALEMRGELFPAANYPQGHSDLANSLNNLGLLLISQGEYAKAEHCLREAMAMWEKLYPLAKYTRGHPDLANSLSALGSLSESRREYADAESYYRQAQAMWEKLYPIARYPQGHPDLVDSLNNLGQLLHSQGDYGKAERYYRQALEMREKLYPAARYPQGHPDLAIGLNNLGFLQHSLGEYARAEHYFRRALAMKQKLLGRYAELAAESEALNYSVKIGPRPNGFLFTTRRLPSSAKAYELIWQDRSLLSRTSEGRKRDLLASKNSQASDLHLRLTEVRQRLHSLLFKDQFKDGKQHLAEVDALTQKKENLEKDLAQVLGLDASPLKLDDTNPQMLQKALPRGTVSLDMLLYQDFKQDPKVPGRKGEKWAPRYVGFLVRSDKIVRIEIGEANPIDKAWQTWRDAIINKDPRERQAAQAFADLFWKPIQENLPADLKTIYLTPDAVLTQVPWGAIPIGDNRVLLEQCAVAVVPHGPYLLMRLSRPAAKRQFDGKMLLVGGVDFDQAPEIVAQGEAPYRNALLREASLVWQKLDKTSNEKDLIAALAGKTTKLDIVEYSGAKATTTQVKQALGQARYAHLATHGFFADEEFQKQFRFDPNLFGFMGRERVTPAARSPLVLTGLVFAGANRKDKDAAADKGILTADGILSERLVDMELAVLSACDTGRGKVEGGEGVFGLQRAFHVAGCKNVVGSLWQVEDESTATLMAVFYSKLWVEKLTPLEALRQAQLHLRRNPQEIATLARLRGAPVVRPLPAKIEPLPAGAKHAPTSQWAAFVLSGLGN